MKFKIKKAKKNENRIQLLEEENKKLRETIQELSILNDIAIAISTTLSLDKIINLIVDKCIKHFEVEQGAVMLVESKKKRQPALHTMVRRIDQTNYLMPYRLNEQLIEWMLNYSKPLIINDISKNENFVKSDSSQFKIHSLVAVPLITKNKMIGVLALFNKKNKKGFTSGDQRLLSIIATESAQVIENARLYKQEQEFKRIKEELRMAFQIQRNLLPKEIPSVKNYDIAAINIPARSVSGDYYDFEDSFKPDIYFCVGDVSGKGMPAALLAANLQATLRGQLFLNNSIGITLKNTNFILYNNSSPEKFATLFFSSLNYQSHILKYSNAGHNPPLFFKNYGDKIIRLREGGMILGIMENSEYREGEIKFEKDDLLVVFSDGITEAMNAEDEEFGEDRLIKAIKEKIREDSNTIVDYIVKQIREFAGKRPQNDDMTIIAIKRKD